MGTESIEAMMKRVEEAEKKQELMSQLLEKMQAQGPEDPNVVSATQELTDFLVHLRAKYGVQLFINPIMGFRRVPDSEGKITGAK